MLGLNNLLQRFTGNQKGTPSSNGMSRVTRDQIPDPVSGNGFTPVDLDLWPEPGHSNYANDVAVVGIGSVTNLLSQFFLGVTGRQVASTALNQVSGAATTHKTWSGYSQSPWSILASFLLFPRVATRNGAGGIPTPPRSTSGPWGWAKSVGWAAILSRAASYLPPTPR